MRSRLWILAGATLLGVMGAAVPASAQASETPQCDWGGSVPPSPETYPEFFDQPIYFDSYGLIVHRRPEWDQNAPRSCDPGDTAQREGWYWFGVYLRQQLGIPWTPKRRLTFDEVIRLLDPDQNGQFRRHPMFSPSDLQWGLSRDQLEPLVAAMGVWGKHEEIRRLWRALPQDHAGKWSLKGRWRNVLGTPPQDCQAIRTQPCPVTPCGVAPFLGVFTPPGAQPTIAPFTVSQPKSPFGDAPPRPAGQPGAQPSSVPSTKPTAPPSAPIGLRLATAKITEPKAITETISTASCSPPSVPVNCEPNFSCPSFLGVEEPLCAHGKNDARRACETLLEQGKQSYQRACDTAQGALKAGGEVLKLACQIEESRARFGCEAGKQLLASTCQAMNHYEGGDYIGPMTVNLFIRALNGDVVSLLTLPPLPLVSFDMGENELAINLLNRLRAVPNDVDADLNLTVKALMATIRLPSPNVSAAIHTYATQRPHSYGSYLRSYYQRYGFVEDQIIERITEGVVQGWRPDEGVSAPFGAYRWYHRKMGGANPSIVELYRPIVDAYIK